MAKKSVVFNGLHKKDAFTKINHPLSNQRRIFSLNRFIQRTNHRLLMMCKQSLWLLIKHNSKLPWTMTKPAAVIASKALALRSNPEKRINSGLLRRPKGLLAMTAARAFLIRVAG
jgi:hypothetical protein